MKITVHCEGTPKEISQQLTEAAKLYNVGKAATKTEAVEEEEETSSISIADIKAARAKKGKKGKAEAEEESEEEESEVDADDEGGEEEESEEEESEEEEFDEEEDDKLSESDLAKLKAALKAYSAKHDKKKAVGILNKFAKRSDDVKPADLPKLLKLLK